MTSRLPARLAQRTPGQALGRSSGQALTEFALVLPLFMLFVFTTIQLSFVFIEFYSETRMARETARWLAINANALDTDVAQHVSNTMLPGMQNGTISADGSSNSTDAYYHVGNLDVKFTACGSSTAPCTNTARNSGLSVYVEMTYNPANVIFLPTTFRLGALSVSIPTTLPPYRVWMMVE
jgi:Flp pilus assembly protein TadG